MLTRRLALEELESRQLLSTASLLSTNIPLTLSNSQHQTGAISQTPTYYAITVTDSGRLTAEVAPTGGATRLSLLSSDGKVLMQSDGQSPSNPNDLLDLHLTGSALGTTYYLAVQGLGTTTGTFDLQTNFATATLPFQPLNVGNTSWGHSFDVNRDGIPDLVVANFTSANISVLIGRGDGTFAPQVTYAVGGTSNDVVAVDLRGNGVSDLVATNFDGSLEILRGRGDGTFDPAIRIALGVSPSSLVAGDFNRDGHLDLAVSDFGAGNVAILLGKGDGTVAAPSFYAVDAGPYNLVVGDFDNDGHLDLAVANYASNSVSILLGNANGTFQGQTSFAVGQSPYGLAVGDFNGDGHLDLASANFTTNDESVLLGVGDGTFAAATSLAAGPGPYGVVAADFNGDGHLDLAATNFTSGTLSIFIGCGDGTFAPEATISVGSTPAFIVVADFNHDGSVDLAHGDYTGHVFIELGRADGTFQTLTPTASGAGVQGVTTADFNRDGILDIATVNYSTSDVQILLGRNDGTFQNGGRYASTSDPISIANGDFDHDGIPDLVITNYSTSNVSVFLGLGDGTFAPPAVFAAGIIPQAVVVGDFNGDGILDLATANTGAGTVSILLGFGDGTFATPLDFRVGNGPYGLIAEDFNDDGILDLATTNSYDGTVCVLFGQGDGTFDHEVQLTAGTSPMAIDAGDFNGDGILDLAVANSGSENVSVFLGLRDISGKASGTFTSQVMFSTGLRPSCLVAVDLNRDGRFDLAVTDSISNSVIVVVGQGDGTFQAGGQVAVGTDPLSIVASELNGDTLPDLVIANANSSDVSVLLGRGNGTFSKEVRVAVVGGSVAIASADFDDDGHLDLITANPLTGHIDISLSNGDGSFRAPITISIEVGPRAVTTGDFNHDGRADLAVANYQTNTVSILLGIGDGTFDEVLSLPVGSLPDDLVTGDFNSDGISDLAVANYGAATVSILLGRADGTFAVEREVAVGAGPVALTVCDIDGDGVTELIVANSLSRTLSILRGARDGSFRLVATVVLDLVPGSVATGDFNGDGKADLAITDQVGNAVWVLLGKGDCTFQVPVRFSTATGPIAVATGDFNGDGHLDLATANTNSNDVTVLLGQGDGTFEAQAPFSVGVYPTGLVASDFNNDGRLDLATANGLGEAVSVGLGFGDGTFTEPGTSFPPVLSRPIVADANGDGTLDVIVLREDGKILFRPGLAGGAGAFGAPVIINPDPTWDARDLNVATALGTTFLVSANVRNGSLSFFTYSGGQFRMIASAAHLGTVPAHLVVGDIDSDGLQDVIFNVADLGQIAVYMQHPNEDFSQRVRPDYHMHVEAGVSSITLADIDGDGRSDIVVSDQLAGAVHVFLNSATNPFSSELTFRAGDGLASVVEANGLPRVESREMTVATGVGLFDGDAIPDLAVLNRGTNRVDILLGEGRGGMFNPSSATSLLTGLDPVSLVTADFNGDGISDLAVSNRGSNDLSIFLGNGLGGFVEQVTIGLDGRKLRIAAGKEPTGLTVADINGDGKLDLLVGNEQGDVLTVLGNGDGTFRPYQRIDRHMGLAVSDVNADGHLEFAFTNESLDSITYLSNQPDESFQLGRQDGVLAPGAVKFADLNGDGIADLIVANSGSNNVLIYLGEGGNSFGSVHRFFVGTAPNGLTLSDLNGDGNLDLVVSNEGSNDLSVLFGQGHGTAWKMTPGPRLEAGMGPVATAVQDVNGDGISDILVANRQSNNVYLLPGVGRGFFDDNNPVIFQTGSNPVELFVGQFDSRPGLDLVTVNAGSNDLTYFSSFGSGQTVSTGGADPVVALAGDFDLDGTSDLIVAHRDGHIALLLGGLGGPQVTTLLDLPSLINVSDLAFGESNATTVDFYATVEGRQEAIPVTFVLEREHGSIPDGPTAAEVVNRQVTEFTSTAGSAELEVLATLTLGFDPSISISPAGSVSGGRSVVAEWVMDEAEFVEKEAVEELVAREDDAEEIERNALIAGIAETPIQNHLDNLKMSEIEVPFSSPLDAFDGIRSTPLELDGEELVSAKSHQPSASPARSVIARRSQPTGSTILDQVSSSSAPSAPIEQPITDELQDGSSASGFRGLVCSLDSPAITLMITFLAQYRPTQRRETPRPRRSIG